MRDDKKYCRKHYRVSDANFNGRRPIHGRLHPKYGCIACLATKQTRVVVDLDLYRLAKEFRKVG